MDRKAWIVITLCILGIVGWNYYLSTLPQPPKPQQRSSSSTPAPATLAPAREQVVAAATSAGGSSNAAENPVLTAAAPVAERFETLTLPQMTVRFTNLGGGIADVTLLGKQHLAANGAHIQLNNASPTPIGALSTRPESAAARVPFEMRREGDNAVIFERTTPEGVRITKRFSIQPGKRPDDVPALELEVRYDNTGSAAFRDPGEYLHVGSAVPIHSNDIVTSTEFGWLRDGKLVHENTGWFDAGAIPIIGIQTHPARPIFTQAVDRLAWVGVKNQFYTTIITPAPGATANAADAATREIWAQRFPLPPTPGQAQNGASARPIYGLETSLGLNGFELAPGASRTEKFQIYTGPTNYERLAQLGRGQDELLQYGWFKPVSLALLGTMNTFKGWFGNYFWAIVALTVLVKILTLYPQLMAQKSMRRMAALAPKTKELKEKYPDDPARLQQETMKMYKEYGVSPFGGCLPALIQMPIFFGFFRMLSNAAELRNSGFLWVHDLSQPDTVSHFFGLPVNPLPLLWGGTMLWQMSLTPATTVDKSQQRMFMFMPLIFVFFCYNFASALSLYYVMQALLTIIQLYATRNQPLPVLTRRQGPPGGGFLANLANAAAQRQQEAAKRGGSSNGSNGGDSRRKPRPPVRLGNNSRP
ncbi:MAG: YidC/Oxa1 family insertase periplasmic-domain containing protein [Verrucomicrobia bacterium]|nr:YidC/Oxa1 family insertase periplasmic-domain containing protein [Verrucomicrobiota bacterium]